MPEVRLNTDADAAASLDAALAHFLALLDHVARFHPAAIRHGFDLEIDQAISGVWVRHDLAQVQPD